MSPQPAAPAAPVETPAPAAPVETPASRQIVRAKLLEKQRGELQTLITSNREYLRLMGKNGELSASETKWVNDFYPEKEKGERRSKDEIDATRKAKEAARKGE